MQCDPPAGSAKLCVASVT